MTVGRAGDAKSGVVGAGGGNLDEMVGKDEENQVKTNAAAQEKLAGAAESFPSAVAGGVGTKPSGGEQPAAPPAGDAAAEHH